MEGDTLKRSLITALVCTPWLFGMAGEAPADSWTCRQGDLTREVVVYYPDAPAPLPCEVFYSKPQENVVPRALWKAANAEGFCERKAAEFVDRLESWGWHCAPDDVEPVSAGEAGETPAAPAD